ncbi:hypothetical protein ABID21_001548 [Pseudorhizobium tarimense]|uniref:Uncharacterized protein n=1 Tax=Pseudorhizobium tarimense TaxID=1079109 RepID=A0ABV2H4J7_9HYPH|nr:hypothetical protein [Pseudorhizobium tarimense]MCJ8518664.1 hypothetical protein [Pseudorhizobium tarimense]
MSEYLTQASYPGEIAVGNDRAPVSYKLKASKEDDGSIHVALSLTAPRDWLLKHGFRSEATLMRKKGEPVPVRFEETLNVADNIAVTLHADESVCRSKDELHQRFPELDA